jgi:integrase
MKAIISLPISLPHHESEGSIMSHSTSTAPGIKWHRRPTPTRPAGLAESRVTIPQELRAAFPGKKSGKPMRQLVQPLGSVTLSQAIAAHAEHRRRCEAKFAELHRLPPSARAIIAERGAEAIHRQAKQARFIAEMFQAEAQRRHSPEEVAFLIEEENTAALARPAEAASLLPDAEAHAREYETLSSAITGTLAGVNPDEATTWTVRHLVKEFLARPGIGASTIRHHRINLDSFMQHLGKAADGLASAVTPLQCSRWIDAAKRRSLQPTSIAQYVSTLQACFTFAVDRDATPVSPARKLKRPQDDRSRAQKRRGFTRAETLAMIDAAREVWQDRPAHRAALSLLITSGARRSEVVNLRVCDLIDHASAGLCVHLAAGNTGKTAAADRVVPVHPFVQAELRALAQGREPNARLFTGLSGPDHFADSIRKQIMTRAGLDQIETLAPAHSFRHAFVSETRAVPGDGDVKRYLSGHASKGDESVRDQYGEDHLPSVREFVDRMFVWLR